MDPASKLVPRESQPRLNSWKEIASYFQRDIRTVQHWERKEGLPVHRHEHLIRASVYAYPAELEAWFNERARKSSAEAAVTPATEDITAESVDTTQMFSSRRIWVLLLSLTLVVAAGVAWFAWRSAHPPGGSPGKTLVVLPFLNLTGDSGQEYMSDGLSDELTTLLASRLPLQVVARSSAFEFKGKTDDVRTIGGRLNASMALEGSLETRGDQLRINAQLVRTSDGYHLWSHLYDTDRGNTSATEDLIVRDIANVLKLPVAENSSPPVSGSDQQAHELYLQGAYWWNRRSPSDEWKAIGYFTAAIDRDPLYARAYLGMAEAYTVLGVNNQAPPQDVFPKAREAAENALRIDPRLEEAHAVHAHIQFAYDWNYAAADSEFRRTIAANPNFAPAHHWYGLLLMYEGKFDEAAQEIRRAQQLDPLSPLFPALLSRLDLYSGKYEAAIQLCRDASRGNPYFPLPHYALGQIYLYQNKYSEAIDEFQKYYELSDHDPDGLTNLAMGYARMGNRAKAMELVKQIEDPKTGYSSPYNCALVYAALGENDQVYTWLDRAINERSPALIQLAVDPAFRSIQAEPRFQEMLRRTGHTT